MIAPSDQPLKFAKSATTVTKEKKIDHLESSSPPKVPRPKARRLGASTSQVNSKRPQRASCGKWSPAESDSSFDESEEEDNDPPILRQTEPARFEPKIAGKSSTRGLPLFAKGRFTSIPDGLDLSSSSDEEEIDQLEEDDDQQINELGSLPAAPGLDIPTDASSTPLKRSLSSSPPPFSVKRSKFLYAEEEDKTKVGSHSLGGSTEEVLMEVVGDGIGVVASSDNTFEETDATTSTVPSKVIDGKVDQHEASKEEEDDDFERWLEDCVEVV